MKKMILLPLLAMLGILASALPAAVIDLPSSGWRAQWSDAYASQIAVEDLGTTGQIGKVGLSLIFDDLTLHPPGYFNPLPITFVQAVPDAASELLIRATIINYSSSALGGLTLKLLGGDGTHFNVAAMNIGNTGGLSVTPFTATFTPDHKQMDLGNGNLPTGQSLVLSRDAGVIVASAAGLPQNVNAFSLKVQPSAAVPEPGMLGVAALACLGVLVRTRQKA